MAGMGERRAKSKHDLAMVNTLALLRQLYPGSLTCVPRIAHQVRPLRRAWFQRWWRDPRIRPELERTSQSRFRAASDLSPLDFIVHASLITRESLTTDKTPSFFKEVKDDTDFTAKVVQPILRDRPLLICINDGVQVSRAVHTQALQKFLESYFSVPSPVERVLLVGESPEAPSPLPSAEANRAVPLGSTTGLESIELVS